MPVRPGFARLEKLLGTIARKAVMKLLRGDARRRSTSRSADIEEYLGKPVFSDEDRIQGVGVVTGLAWTAMGGATLDIEATRSHDFNARIPPYRAIRRRDEGIR